MGVSYTNIDYVTRGILGKVKNFSQVFEFRETTVVNLLFHQDDGRKNVLKDHFYTSLVVVPHSCLDAKSSDDYYAC